MLLNKLGKYNEECYDITTKIDGNDTWNNTGVDLVGKQEDADECFERAPL